MTAINVEAKRRGVENRRGLYSRAAKFASKAIDELVKLMTQSRNESVRLGAARIILDKCLPDCKAIAELDVTTTPLVIKIVEENQSYVS